MLARVRAKITSNIWANWVRCVCARLRWSRCRPAARRRLPAPSVASNHVASLYFALTLCPRGDCVASLMLRFPIAEDCIRISFVWFSIFNPKHQVSSYSPFMEQTNQLFNLAVTLSTLGSLQSVDNDAALKLAATYFQSAAGVVAAIIRDTEQHPQQVRDREACAPRCASLTLFGRAACAHSWMI